MLTKMLQQLPPNDVMKNTGVFTNRSLSDQNQDNAYWNDYFTSMMRVKYKHAHVGGFKMAMTENVTCVSQMF